MPVMAFVAGNARKDAMQHSIDRLILHPRLKSSQAIQREDSELEGNMTRSNNSTELGSFSFYRQICCYVSVVLLLKYFFLFS